MPDFLTFPDAEREDIAPRTAAGALGLRFPEAAGDVVEHRKALPGCTGCASSATHGPPCRGFVHSIPHGEHRHAHVPAAKRFGAWYLFRILAAQSLAAYCHYGIAYDLLFNMGLGTANNISQQWGYLIVDVDGYWLTLKGPNPKKLTVGVWRTNPEWPFADPVTGQYGAIVSDAATLALMPGSLVRFEPPSVLSGKLEPRIVEVEPPVSTDLDDVTFRVRVHADISGALQPIDAKFPPGDGRYYCTVFAYASFPEPWANFQEPVEAQFTRRRVEVSAAALASASWSFTFKDTAGGNTRILYPTMGDAADTLLRVRYYTAGGPPTTIPNATLLPLLATSQTSATAFSTTLNLASLAAVTGLERVVLDFFCERLPGDDSGLVFAGACANSQVDQTGSYAHAAGRRCTRVDCSAFAGFATRGGMCWLPEADGFCLGNEGDAWQGGRMVKPPTDPLLNPGWVRDFWMAVSIAFIQGMPGVSGSRNFAFQRMGIPGVCELLGNWSDSVPGGRFERRLRFQGPVLGRRVEEDTDDGPVQRVVTGAFFAAGEQDAAGDPILGSLPEEAEDWMDKEDALGAFPEATRAYPPWGVGTIGLHTHQAGGNSIGKVARKSAAAEDFFATALSLTGEESADWIDARVDLFGA